MLRLYHGGIETIEFPDVSTGRPDVDFGQGFYVTSLLDQAVRWAKRRHLRALGSSPVVTEFEYLSKEAAHLQIKSFDGYSERWLDFVIAHRTRKENSASANIDIVIGNVADDDVINAIDRYIELLEKGRATSNAKFALLDELSFAQPNDQYCFRTLRSLDALKFTGSEVLNG